MKLIIIKNLIGWVLAPRLSRFVETLSQRFLKTTKEMGKFDDDLLGLCILWIAVCPYHYFNDIFIRTKEMNQSFSDAFYKSSMKGAQEAAQDCYNLTQAYFLRHLFQILIQDEKYKKFSIPLIKKNIRSHMEHGAIILNMASEFEENVSNMSIPQQFVMCYVEKIINIIYPEPTKRERVISGLWHDVQSLLGADIITTMAITKAKEIDRESGRV